MDKDELLKQRKQLAKDFANKTITEEEFNIKFKELSQQIADINAQQVAQVTTTAVGTIVAEEIVKKLKVQKPKVEKVEKKELNVSEVIKFLKNQPKPVDNSKELKRKIFNELKILKIDITDIQKKLKKM